MTSTSMTRQKAKQIAKTAIKELRDPFARALVQAWARDLKIGFTDPEVEGIARQLVTVLRDEPDLDIAVAIRQAAVYHSVNQATAVAQRNAMAKFSAGGPVQQTSTCVDPCVVSDLPMCAPHVPKPTGLIHKDRIQAAGTLAVIQQYGTRMGMFEAIDVAIKKLNTGEFCVDAATADSLYCWSERDVRVTAAQQAQMTAAVLGLREPDLPSSVKPDPVIQNLLGRLLTELSAVCSPACGRKKPTSAQTFRTWSAADAVRIHLSDTVSPMTELRVRDLGRQFTVAVGILSALSPQLPCAPKAVTQQGGQQPWTALTELIGQRLPDGTELVQAARAALAWRKIFQWLRTPPKKTDKGVCRAAEFLLTAAARKAA